MRVAVFTECYHPIINGVVVSVATFVTELRRLGAEVWVVAPRFPGYHETDPQVVRVASITFPVEPKYPLAVPLPGWGMALDRRRPQLVHTQSPFLMGRAGLGAARRWGVPVVFTFHTMYEEYVHYLRPLPQGPLRRYARELSRGYANRVDRVIAPSQGLREILLGDGVTTPIEVLPTGIDLSLADREKLGPIRFEFEIPADAPLLLYAGRVAQEKNIGLMLEAFAQVRRSHPQARLLVAGGGPGLEAARRAAAHLGIDDAVRLAGYLDRRDVFRCAAEADVFLFPSVTDTQGIVIVEAMALGVPCVATESAAVGGLVVSGRNGLVTGNSAPEFARGVLRLLADPELRRRMGAAARETASGYAAGPLAERLLAIYGETIDAAGRAA